MKTNDLKQSFQSNTTVKTRGFFIEKI